MRNTQLLLKMLKQYYKSPTPLFSLPTAELNQVLDDFEGLPLLFMNFYGATSIDTVCAIMFFVVLVVFSDLILLCARFWMPWNIP